MFWLAETCARIDAARRPESCRKPAPQQLFESLGDESPVSYYRMLAERSEEDSVGKMKQFATYFTHGVRNGARLRAEIYAAHQVSVIRDLVDAFFERELAGIAA